MKPYSNSHRFARYRSLYAESALMIAYVVNDEDDNYDAYDAGCDDDDDEVMTMMMVMMMMVMTMMMVMMMMVMTIMMVMTMMTMMR